jgi:hypothetical protein
MGPKGPKGLKVQRESRFKRHKGLTRDLRGFIGGL